MPGIRLKGFNFRLSEKTGLANDQTVKIAPLLQQRTQLSQSTPLNVKQTEQQISNPQFIRFPDLIFTLSMNKRTGLLSIKLHDVIEVKISKKQ